MIYYKNETLYIEVVEELDEMKYLKIKKKIMGIIQNYGVDKIVIFNGWNGYKNRSFLRRMKEDLGILYDGELILE